VIAGGQGEPLGVVEQGGGGLAERDLCLDLRPPGAGGGRLGELDPVLGVEVLVEVAVIGRRGVGVEEVIGRVVGVDVDRRLGRLVVGDRRGAGRLVGLLGRVCL